MCRRLNSMGGLAQETASVASAGDSPATLAARATGKVASNPSVVIRPIGAPVPVSRALSPTVVAYPMDSARLSTSPSGHSKSAAAASTDASAPAVRSPGVDSALPTPALAVSSETEATTTASVNVPPVSIPMRTALVEPKAGAAS